MAKPVTVEQIKQELHDAYQPRLEIAIKVLQYYSGTAEGGRAQDALDKIRGLDDATPTMPNITYKFVKIHNRNSVYNVIDKDYGGCTWEISLTPEERGYLLESIVRKTLEKRSEHDSSVAASD